jgi:hypothetical protein
MELREFVKQAIIAAVEAKDLAGDKFPQDVQFDLNVSALNKISFKVTIS